MIVVKFATPRPIVSNDIIAPSFDVTVDLPLKFTPTLVPYMSIFALASFTISVNFSYILIIIKIL
jgi:hypothetical protein